MQHDRRGAHHPRGQGHALRVVARGERDDPPGALGRRQRGELVQRAADLEGAGALEVLALEEHLMPAGVVERLAADDRRAMDARAQPPGGGPGRRRA
jgi:hypothetical protein